MRTIKVLLPLVASAACVAGDLGIAGAGPPSIERAFYAESFSKIPSAGEMTELGRLLFTDRSLSASGRMACASCHDPKLAYGPPNPRPVQPGGAKLELAGIRAAPSLRYLQTVPPFTEHFEDDEQGG